MSHDKNQPQLENGNGNDLKKIEQELVRAHPNLFKDIPDQKKTEILKIFSMSLSIEQTIEGKITAHRGPLPHWEDLEKYDQIIPNGADRIMTMAEKQQDHRMSLETIAITEQLTQSKRGQTFGLLIGLTAIVGGVACILLGHEWSGAFLGGGGLTGLVSVFVIGKKKQAKNLDDKA
jgi:uncharacterized membrane protein